MPGGVAGGESEALLPESEALWKEVERNERNGKRCAESQNVGKRGG